MRRNPHKEGQKGGEKGLDLRGLKKGGGRRKMQNQKDEISKVLVRAFSTLRAKRCRITFGRREGERRGGAIREERGIRTSSEESA